MRENSDTMNAYVAAFATEQLLRIGTREALASAARHLQAMRWFPERLRPTAEELDARDQARRERAAALAAAGPR